MGCCSKISILLSGVELHKQFLHLYAKLNSDYFDMKHLMLQMSLKHQKFKQTQKPRYLGHGTERYSGSARDISGLVLGELKQEQYFEEGEYDQEYNHDYSFRIIMPIDRVT